MQIRIRAEGGSILLSDIWVLTPGPRVACEVTLDVPQAYGCRVHLSATYREGAFGHFLEDLSRAYETLSGKARLLTDGGGPEIVFRMLPERPGVVAVDCIAAWHDHAPAQGAAAIEVTGLLTDQSYLPGVIRDFEECLQELGTPGL